MFQNRFRNRNKTLNKFLYFKNICPKKYDDILKNYIQKCQLTILNKSSVNLNNCNNSFKLSDAQISESNKVTTKEGSKMVTELSKQIRRLGSNNIKK